MSLQVLRVLCTGPCILPYVVHTGHSTVISVSGVRDDTDLSPDTGYVCTLNSIEHGATSPETPSPHPVRARPLALPPAWTLVQYIAGRDLQSESLVPRKRLVRPPGCRQAWRSSTSATH